MDALKGLKVLELGQVVAAPFCGALLADFGAEVVKVEIPGVGDDLRRMGPIVDKRSLWFMTENRNKRLITLNLKHQSGQEILTRLLPKFDVLLENFRVGTMEKFGFPWERVHALNPKAIMVRISGYGQTGPFKDRCGYDRIGLGMGGLSYLTGNPDEPPMRPGLSVADYLAGYSAALGILTAVYSRDVNKSGEGQMLDISLYDTVFRISEFTALDYQLTGSIRRRVGNTFPVTVPSGHFKTKDGKWVSVAVGNDRLFERFCHCIGREDFLQRKEYASTALRAKNRTEIDQACSDWISAHTQEECFAAMANQIPVGPVNSIEDIFKDPQFKARHNLTEVNDPQFGPLETQSAVPMMSETPGQVKWLGGSVGEHNAEVYGELLGFTAQDLAQLQKDGVI